MQLTSGDLLEVMLKQARDVENEGNGTVSEHRRAGDTLMTFHRPAQRLEHGLHPAKELVEDETDLLVAVTDENEAAADAGRLTCPERAAEPEERHRPASDFRQA